MKIKLFITIPTTRIIVLFIFMGFLSIFIGNLAYKSNVTKITKKQVLADNLKFPFHSIDRSIK